MPIETFQPIETSDFVFRTLTALGLGLLIGIERQMGQHPAGVRTNSLVCLGSALFVCLSQTMAGDSPTRIAAQVVSGIGFLGGGAILREGVNVRGMNTAATLWCTAAIGTLAGAGSLLYAFLGAVAILLSHLLFRPIAHAIDEYTHGAECDVQYEVKIVCLRTQEEALRKLVIEQIRNARMRLDGVSLHDGLVAGNVEASIHVGAKERNDQVMNDLVSLLTGQAGVVSVRWKK